jgi:prevent-host-death family protein
MRAIAISVFEAKTKFAELLEKVAGGQEFLITKRGKPVARLVSDEAGAASNTGKSTAWELYQKIQKGGRKLSERQLAGLVRESRRESKSGNGKLTH